jgi:hypothetical protein
LDQRIGFRRASRGLRLNFRRDVAIDDAFTAISELD